MAFAIMRSKKHKLGGGLKTALQHLYRERDTPNADPSITNLSWKDIPVEKGSETALQRLHSEFGRITESGSRKIRSDAVVAIEYMMTASPEFFSKDSAVRKEQATKFGILAREWIESEFPEGQIIAAQIHMDETTPHVSLFVTPTTTNEKGKLSLNAKKFLGGRKKLADQQTRFAKKMSELGLERGVEKSRANHQAVSKFYGKLKEIKGQDQIKEKYYEAIEDLESKLIGGKADLAELARKMADDIAVLRENYLNNEVAAQEDYKQKISVYEDILANREASIRELNGRIDRVREENAGLREKVYELEGEEKLHKTLRNAVYNAFSEQDHDIFYKINRIYEDAGGEKIKTPPAKQEINQKKGFFPRL